MAALIFVHLLTYFLKFKDIIAAPRDWGFAFLYGGSVAAVLPLVNIKVVPFIYFRF